MKSFAIAVLLGAASASYETLEDADYEFIKFIAEHGKSYGTKEEFEFRASVFKDNLRAINEFNAGNHTSTVAVNFMADLTSAEAEKYFGLLKSQVGQKPKEAKVKELTGDLPAKLDWMEAGAVSKTARDTGECSASWAFAAAEVIDGAFFVSTGERPRVSVQQLVDCANGTDGCNGGTMSASFDYAQWFDMMSYDDYPYTGEKGDCQYDQTKTKYHIGDWFNVQTTIDQIELANTKGPIAVSVEADETAFKFYSGGIITSGCGSKLNHGVLLYGFENTDGALGCKRFGHVKNFWGSKWGVDGNAMICFSTDSCGILDDASYCDA